MMPPKLKQSLSRDETGTSTLEFSLVYGLLLAMIMLVVHVGFLYNADLTVSDAADAALESYTLHSGTEASARAAAEFIADGAPLENLSVSLWQKDGEAFVRVRADSPSYFARSSCGCRACGLGANGEVHHGGGAAMNLELSGSEPVSASAARRLRFGSSRASVPKPRKSVKGAIKGIVSVEIALLAIGLLGRHAHALFHRATI